MTQFSDLLKNNRLRLRKTIEELSESSDLAMSVISRLENNLSQPTVLSLVKLAYALTIKSGEVSASLGFQDIFGRAINEPKPNREDMPLFIGDIEAFLAFFNWDVDKAKSYIYSAYEKVVCTANPNLPADELRELAWDSVKNATFPTSNLYTPLPYPSVIDPEYIKIALIDGGILTFPDVGYFIRENRVSANLSLRDLSNKTNISFNTISRLERGLIDRLFLNEIIKIDAALDSKGLIFNMFWAAGEFHSGVIRNKLRGLELDPPLAWTDREHALANTIVKIERWSASLNIPFLSDFRNLVFYSGTRPPANQDGSQA